jgi:hypothetical protein
MAELLRERSYPIDVIAVRPKLNPHVAAIPAKVRKRLRERREARLRQGIVFFPWHEDANAPHAVALLRARRERPRRRAAAPPKSVMNSRRRIIRSPRRRAAESMGAP